jgi:hypothetical protein
MNYEEPAHAMAQMNIPWSHMNPDSKILITTLHSRYVTIPPRSGELTLPDKRSWLDYELPSIRGLMFRVLRVYTGRYSEEVYYAYFDNWFDTIMNMPHGQRWKFKLKDYDKTHDGVDDHSLKIIHAIHQDYHPDKELTPKSNGNIPLHYIINTGYSRTRHRLYCYDRRELW